MTALDYRVSDQVVRRYPLLADIALEFVTAYDGEFDPLLKLKEVARRYGTLSVVQARVALNCLRQEADPYWNSLRIEAESVMSEASPTTPGTRRHLEVVRSLPSKEERPWQVRLPVHLKVGIVTPKPRNGALHLPTEAECWWEDQWAHGRVGRSKFQRRVPKLVVYTECDNSYYNPLLLTEDEMLTSGRSFCRAGCWPEDE